MHKDFNSNRQKNKNIEENIEYVYLGRAKTLRKDLFSPN